MVPWILFIPIWKGHNTDDDAGDHHQQKEHDQDHKDLYVAPCTWKKYSENNSYLG